MLKLYGYIGIALVLFAELNFLLVIMPFASWYIVIVWYGYMLFIDSIVYKICRRSLISSYPKEFALMIVLSVPFWLIFELYNLYTGSWSYINYAWYVHLLDFTTILPAIMETFTLMNALRIGRRFDSAKKRVQGGRSAAYYNIVKLLVIIGALAALMPFIDPEIGYLFIWTGLFLFLDPLNYVTGRPSIIDNAVKGKRSMIVRLFLSGIIMGFFWEFWNYQAYPKWVYTFPGAATAVKLFAMPLPGYFGYFPFALEAFLFYAFFRSFIFKGPNSLISL